MQTSKKLKGKRAKGKNESKSGVSPAGLFEKTKRAPR